MSTDKAPDDPPSEANGSIDPPEPARPAAIAPESMGFWKCFREIHRFAFSSVFGLVVLEVVLLLAVLGVIGDGFGAFNVVWHETTFEGRWHLRALFWNGFGVATFYLVVGYMVYMHYARAHGGVRWGRERALLYLTKSAPPLVLACLPALLPGPFAEEQGTPTFDGATFANRLPYLAGVGAALAFFTGSVALLTNFNAWRHSLADWLDHRRAGRAAMSLAGEVAGRVAGLFHWIPARLRGLPAIQKSPLDRQADGLYGAVILIYSGLVGYTLVDSYVAIETGYIGLLTLFLVVLGFLMLRYPVGGTAFTAFAIVAAYAVRPRLFEGHDYRLTTEWPWLNAPCVLLAMRLVLFAWYLTRRAPGPFQSRRFPGVVRRLTWKHWPAVGRIATVLLPALGILVFEIRHGIAVRSGWDWNYFLAALGAVAVLVPTVRGLWQPEAYRNVSYFAGMIFWALFGGLLGWLLGSWFGVVRTEAGVSVLPAGLSACLLLAVLAAAYSALNTYAGAWFYPVCLAIAGGFALIGAGRPYPHQIEELAPEYERADAIRSLNDTKSSKFNLANYVKDRRMATNQLRDNDIVGAWHAGLGDGPKPLVIVTCAGGASVSAIYCYNALVGLERAIPGFHRYVRIVTGASGGMLGASYYRAMLHRYYQERSRPDVQRHATLADFLEANKPGLTADFLSPILQGAAFKDVPMALGCPFGFWDDRGRRLERAWQKHTDGALEITLQTQRDMERSGRFPSMIFSPMIVEDGRPLLISTLDLDWNFAVPDNVGYAPVRALELIKMFPNTAWNLRLGTAARLSSGFPFFSPAASLPTIPPRRVVDAGYLDNYGVSMALSWLRRIAEKDWFKARVSQVVMIELRPYGQWDELTLTEDEYLDPSIRKINEETVGRVPPFVDPFQELTSPLAGAGSARKAGMNARNAEQFDLLQSRLEPKADKKLGQVPYLSKVSFKGELANVSLNWTLSFAERRQIEQAVDSIFVPWTGPGKIPGPSNMEEFDILKKLVPPLPEPAR